MKTFNFILITIFTLLLFSCNEQVVQEEEQAVLVSVKTVQVKQGDIENNITLNGKTICLKKNTVISPIAGYIAKINVKFGDSVQKNDILFEIQTKENKALGNTDSLKNIKVLASSEGYVNELNINQTGSYVVEGNLLCNIIENNNLMIQINVPFEYNSLVKTGTKCSIVLADNTTFDGVVYQVLPVINETDQTQNVLIKPITTRQLPENLNLTVKIVNTKHSLSLLIPKAALMTNETQTEFWVMKLTDDSLAIKVPVIKGIANDSIAEISTEVLTQNDFVIGEGAYGLADSTVVKIVD